MSNRDFRSSSRVRHAGSRLALCLLCLFLIAISVGCSFPGIPRKPTPSPTPITPTSTATPLPTATPTPRPLPPAVVESDPQPGSEIPLRGPITLYFNQPMDRPSVEAALTDSSWNVAWADDATLTFTPARPLSPASEVSLKLNTAARAANGLPLSAPVDLSYRTAGYLQLAQRLPEPGAVGVDPSSAIVAAFNRPTVPLGADPTSLPSAFTLEPAAQGHGEWLNTSTYVFYPDPPLGGGVRHTVHPNPNLTDTSGSPLEKVEAWSFTTAPPRLVSIEPTAGANNVRLDAPVELTFNQPMDADEVANNFALLDPAGVSVSGQFGWNDDFTTLTFTPTILLKRGTTYTVVVNTAARSAGGTTLNAEISAGMRTVPPLDVLSSEPESEGVLRSYGSLAITFNAPVRTKDILQFIAFSPDVPNLRAYSHDGGYTVRIFGDFTPETDYHLIFSPNLPDVWNGRLGREFSLDFRTAPLDPNLIVTQGSNVLFLTPQDTRLTVQATNLSRLPMSLGSLSLADMIAMLAPNGYDYMRTYRASDQRDFRQELDLTPNRSQPVDIPLSLNGKPLGPGLYLLRFNLSERGIYVGPYLLVVSNVHLTFKLGATEAFVWAVDLRDDSPLANAPVSIYAEDGALLAAGQTDAEGIFHEQFSQPIQNPWATNYAVIGQPGEDAFALALSTWDQQVGAWSFGIAADYTPPHLEAYLYTDRPIYRPGQTVYFRAIARQVHNGRYALADVSSLPLTLSDETGNQIASFDLRLSAFGSAHGSYTLPADAVPGHYTLLSERADYSSVSFQVAEYRKPEINLQVSFDADQALGGQSLSALVDARYFFDAPAGNIPVHWALYKEPSYFSLPGYHVGKEDDRWLEAFPRGFPGLLGILVSEGDGETDPAGQLRLELATTPDDNRQRYTLEVTATDESGLPVSAHASLQVNPANLYIGVRPDVWVGQSGSPFGFEVLVVDWARKPAGVRSLHAEFQKVVWERVDPPPDEPHGFPTFVPRYTLIKTNEFVTNAEGIARLSFTPPEAGAYQLSVSGSEADAKGAITQVTVWVGGAGQAVWPNLPNQRLRLTADRDSYQPGQTAQVFIPNPFGATVKALVTVERGVVLRHQVLTLSGAGVNLSLPLTAEDAPNVYISVTQLGQTAAGRPDFRLGYLNLPVEPIEQTLTVELTSQPQRTGPGEQVTFSLRVTDSAGQPAQGEFSLSVVDLAVLALADPNSEDIVPALYGNQPLGVRTGLALAVYAQRQLYLPEGGMGGGGGMSPVVVREKFPDTAFWNAKIVTDANGEAQVTVPLPDSLTTWQVDVRGITADSRVGQAGMQVVVTKDVLIRPVTPRFLVVGDHALLAAIVQNNTADPLQAEVSLQVSGFTLDDPASVVQSVSLPAGGRARVAWWGVAQDVEKVDAVFSARAGAYSDAARPTYGALPVLRFTAPQTFGTAGVLDQEDELLELVSLPRSFDPRGGSLSIQLSPSIAAAMLNALDALEHFPYECTEQTISRFLPNLETYRVLQEFGLESPVLQARLERTLDEGLAKLIASQNEDGGWGWWPAAGQPQGGGGSDAYITAYVLFGLGRAQQAGVVVNPDVIAKGVNYLYATMPTPQMLTESWQLDRLAFELYALDQAGAADVGAVMALNEVRDRLDPWAQALLALMIEGLSPDDAKALYSSLATAAVRSATGAHWENREAGWRVMSTPIHATAVALYALAQHDPASPLVADATRYLMAHRNASGSWSSTFETAWTLMALSQVMKGTAELGGDFTFSATLDHTPLVSGQASGETQLTPVSASVPIGNLHPDIPNALYIRRGAGAGRLYYTAHLSVSRPVEEVAPLSRGVTVSRAYYAVSAPFATQQPVSEGDPIHAAQTGDLVRVRITLVVPETAYYLLVEDYLPAGAEVLDTRLKTSQLGADGCQPQSGNCYNPHAPFADGWGWWYFDGLRVYDDHVSWAAETLPPGTYELVYTLVMLQAGEYRVLPARAWQFYFPEVQGNSTGEVFAIGEKP